MNAGSGFPREWGPYEQLFVRYDDELKALWYHLAPRSRPCFNLDLLSELRLFQQRVRLVNQAPDNGLDSHPIRYTVLASSVPGVFNLGGDLQLFSKLIALGNRTSMQALA